MFEDPKYDCDAAEFGRFMTAMIEGFIHDERARALEGGSSSMANAVGKLAWMPTRSRSEWVARFERWFETPAAREAVERYMRDFARRSGLLDTKAGA